MFCDGGSHSLSKFIVGRTLGTGNGTRDFVLVSAFAVESLKFQDLIRSRDVFYELVLLKLSSSLDSESRMDFK